MEPEIILIGGVPEPIGGVTTHVWQLGNMLAMRGLKCTVIDMYGRKRKVSVDSALNLHVLRGPKILRFIELCALSMLKGGSILHYHLSEGSSFLKGSRLLLASGKRSALICTVHSGNIEGYYLQLPDGEKRRFKTALNKMDRIVALSDRIACFLAERISIPDGKIVHSTSFVAPSWSALQLPGLSAAAHKIRSRAFRMITTSGYRQPLYCYEDFVACVEEARKAGDVQGVIVTYGQNVDHGYWADIQKLIRTKPYIHVLDPMPYDEFLALLKSSDLYLRCTRSDSHALAVSESIALGTPTVATDVCVRQKGTVVVPLGNQELLFREIVPILADPGSARARLMSIKLEDATSSLLAMYEELARSKLGYRDWKIVG
jgi:glycosyltransferase involved in cell wall biosynthesis